MVWINFKQWREDDKAKNKMSSWAGNKIHLRLVFKARVDEYKSFPHILIF